MVDDPEIRRQADALRGLLYLACPDAPPAAISDTAQAIAERSGDRTPPTSAVAEAARLTTAPRPDSRPPHNLSGADLSGADLSGADLSGANLLRANLTRADLTRAILPGAEMRGADLTGVNLSDAILTRADLSDAILTAADLSDANLADAKLTRVNLTAADLTDADLSGANLSGANLAAARQLRLVSGILWNLDTHWPDGYFEKAYARSDEVRPGSYRLRGGTASDRSSTLV
ncbi:pentapeptide repeat-containing protein [Streptomyces niveus]|uniref:pentapeptide repeat-containing protein n=1 Tax=Streptomyces niveus TaxID=193462 RepID=UPI00364E4D65